MSSEQQQQPPPLRQMTPWFDDCEANAVHAYMKGGGWLTEFEKTREFEDTICAYTGAKHCFVVNNGTVSLTVALAAFGVGPGDEVIVPNFTMIATPNAARILGATVVYADIEPTTLNISLCDVERRITSKTKAVVHVSLHGRCSDVVALRNMCEARGIMLLEDSAQSLGSFRNGQHVGTFGHIGSFSFSAPKIISTGQGGCLVTNDDALASIIRRLKDFGRDAGGTDSHACVGWNFKFTDLQAVVGIEQMKKLPWRVGRMREIWHRYYTTLRALNQVTMIPTHEQEAEWTPWFIDIYVDDPLALGAFLDTQRIGTRLVYPACHTQPAYQSYNNLPGYDETLKWTRRGIWLPSSSRLSNVDIDRVCNAIIKFYSPKISGQQSKL